jgi:GNAT superfamily N-acetyltransferase
MGLKIRYISPLDRAALLDILKNTPEFKYSEVVVARELIDACLRDKEKSGYFILVAEDNQRGHGVGGTLLKAAEREIRESGGRLALVETSSTPAYVKTRQFYDRHGYDEVARVPDFYKPDDDKLTLQKKFG